MNRKKISSSWGITATKQIEQLKILLDSLTQLSKSWNKLTLTLYPYAVILTLTPKDILYTLVS